ncbi:MAG: hypothetical protein WDO68_31985 [Gammaproteobacteria bacterium]
MNDADLHFPGAFSSELPYDVAAAKLSSALARDLLTAKPQPPTEELRVPKSQRLFDIFAWQAFLALNWPAASSGKPDATKTLADGGPRVWEYWMETSQLFKLDGGEPDAWPQTLAQARTPLDRTKAAWTTGLRADQNLQAFSGPLVDQNGKWVRYQVKINREEYDYIVANKLYNLDGQIEFSRTSVVSFPIGDVAAARRGAIELKMAWKELGPTDIPSRYYTVDGQVKNNDTGKFEARTLGLVGMHIAMRTASSPQWMWATFEQVDNVNANELESGIGLNGKPVAVHANFNRPASPTALPNVLPAKNAVIDATTGLPRELRTGETADGWLERLTAAPVQVTRVVPIPNTTAALNAEVQALLRQVKGTRAGGSVFQHYELIGAQWPVFPGSSAFPSGAGSAPESIVHKTPGAMVPVYVANTTMETYFQTGVQVAGPLAQDDRLAPNVFADTTMVFGTESCVGCHYSSGIAVGYRTVDGQKKPIFGINSNDGRTGSANYSWLLQMEAKFRAAPALSPKRHDYEVGGGHAEPSVARTTAPSKDGK